jgi:hypothetical protein
MMPVIILNTPGLSTGTPKMEAKSRKDLIEERKSISKPIVDEVGRRLTEMGIESKPLYAISSIVVIQDVNDCQLDIIKSWEEVKSVADGDMPIHLIK